MIEVLKYEKITKNKLIGYVDIKIPKWGVIIRHISHYESNGKRWFNFPSYTVPQEDGKYKFIPTFEWEAKTTNEMFMKKLYESVDEYIKIHSERSTKEIIDESYEKSAGFNDECPF
jgi:hypothetical protein